MLASIPGFFALIYVPNKLIVHGNAAATAHNIAASETLFRLDALAMLFLNLHGYGFDIAAIFWGLWLFPLGLLVYRSGFFPRLNSFSFPANSLTALAAPNYQAVVSRWTSPLQFGELAFMLWLLVMGAKHPANPARFENPPAPALNPAAPR